LKEFKIWLIEKSTYLSKRISDNPSNLGNHTLEGKSNDFTAMNSAPRGLTSRISIK